MIAWPGRIGVVTGSRLEARCLDHRPPGLVVCSGADPTRARTHALRLVRQGVDGLVSFGFAGALDPALRPGDLVLPDVVVAAIEGEPAHLLHHRPPPSWREAAASRLEDAGLAVRGGAILGSDRMIGSPQAKAELLQVTGAAAVDMESHVVAEMAEGGRLPWLVLRCVADPADLALPAYVGASLGGDGEIRGGWLAAALIRQPATLPALIRLHRYSRRASEVLTRAAELLLPRPAER